MTASRGYESCTGINLSIFAAKCTFSTIGVSANFLPLEWTFSLRCFWSEISRRYSTHYSRQYDKDGPTETFGREMTWNSYDTLVYLVIVIEFPLKIFHQVAHQRLRQSVLWFARGNPCIKILRCTAPPSVRRLCCPRSLHCGAGRTKESKHRSNSTTCSALSSTNRSEGR